MNDNRVINFNVIGEAFNIVKNRWQPFVLAGLVAVVAICVVMGIFLSIFFMIGLVGGDRPVTGLLMLPFMAVCYFVVLTLSSVFQAGLIGMALKAVRGEETVFNDVLVPLKAPVPFLVTGLIVGLGTAIGAMFCYLPGIVFAGLTMFAYPLMIDQKLAPMDAVKRSIEILKNQWLMAGCFFLVVSLVGGVGEIACFVGVFFTMPVMFVAIALCYRDLVWDTGGLIVTAPEAVTPAEATAAESELANPPEPPAEPEPPVEPPAPTEPPDEPEPPRD